MGEVEGFVCYRHLDDWNCWRVKCKNGKKKYLDILY